MLDSKEEEGKDQAGCWDGLVTTKSPDLQRTWVLFPGPTEGLTTISNSSFSGSNALFWPPAPGMQVEHMHNTDKTCIHMKKD